MNIKVTASTSLYCDGIFFMLFQNIDGAKFLSMSKADIMKLVNNKIGPCLKVENLLTLLKARMNPAQARYLATIRKTN
jgi:hypothetical protein